jgi:hypothetical protein
MTKKVKTLLNVKDNHKPNAPLQFKVKEDVKKNSKLKPKDVFDLKQKDKKPNLNKKK